MSSGIIPNQVIRIFGFTQLAEFLLLIARGGYGMGFLRDENPGFLNSKNAEMNFTVFRGLAEEPSIQDSEY